VIGSLQATEVIKYLTGRGRLLANRLVLWDGMQAKADEIIVERNPDCPACGDRSPHKRRHT
jgi:molybdopterin/thiamine biosynthesis adenylyltransferase